MKLPSAFATMMAMAFLMLMLVNVAALPAKDKDQGLGDGNARNLAAINDQPLRPGSKGGYSPSAYDKFDDTINGPARNDRAMKDQPVRPLTPAGLDLQKTAPKPKCEAWKFIFMGWFGAADCIKKKMAADD